MSLNAIGIVSDDPEKSMHFYALLGVNFKKNGDHDHFEAATESGVRLMLDSVELIQTFEPTYQKRPGTGPVLCFQQPSPARVDEVYRQVLAAGFTGKKAPWDAFWGQRYACVLDPDGNQIDLFAALS
jgi:catechol 2,3-dioxygenase-like lactoylglutathione lyase family enzyme